MPKVELYTYKCLDCSKVFRTNNPEQKNCSSCLKYRQPNRKSRKKKIKKPLTFAEILHIGNVYYKIHHQYLHYGDIVRLIDSNAEHCVCCGAAIPEGRQICLRCERM